VIGVEVKAIPLGSEPYKKHQKLIRRVNKWQRFLEKSWARTAEKARALEEKYGETFYIKANKSVLLTTGSFSFNRDMLRHYAPAYYDGMSLGTLGCDGSGILLGQSVGGDVGYMDSVTSWRTISPSEEFVKALVVNSSGKRFIPEDAYLGHLGRAIVEQEGKKAWLIITSKTYWRAYKDVVPRFGQEGYLEFKAPLLVNLLFNSTRGKTLSDLATKIGIDPEGLQAQVEQYNKDVIAGQDRLQKKTSNCAVLGEGPYFAIDISISNRRCMCPIIPMGGLRVDEDSGQVLRADGTGIKGLYAAGRAAVGIPSGFYVSGSSLADCVFSGRRAGAHAAGAVA
jgi:3-oxo-5alpha-steroid 4-dehydrogenase